MVDSILKFTYMGVFWREQLFVTIPFKVYSMCVFVQGS